MSHLPSMKLTIIGSGHVGATAAFAALLDGTPTEIMLYARDKKRSLGEKLDLEHALPFLDYVKITATDNLADAADSQLIVMTAGVAQKPGETRLDLCKNNAKILEEILPPLIKAAPQSPILMVANPVDVLTNMAHTIVPDAAGRIFGSGTLLDTSRFRYHLGEAIGVNPQSIHAYILGEHGDSSFPVYANATVGGQKLLDFPNMNKEIIDQAYQAARTAAYNIIQAKGATYYAIAVVIRKIMEAMFSNAHTIFPLSVPLKGAYGFEGVSLSLPCVLGSQGVERVLHIDLSDEEHEKLKHSVEVLQQFC